MNYLKPFLITLLFPLSQVFVALVAEILYHLLSIQCLHSTPLSLSAITLLSGILTVAVACRWGLVRRSAFSLRRPQSWPRTLAVVTVSMLFILTLSYLSERIGLPDNLAEQMQQLVRHPLGFLTVAAVAPIVEEIVFRESLLGGLVRGGMRPSWAVCLSALAFGIVHGNPVQIPFAVVIGLFFGVLYLRRGNLRLVIVLHILNNTIAALQLIFET